MEDFIIPTTYEEARRMGVYWDWNSILLTNLSDRARYIAINLLEKGVTVENVYEAVGKSDEEYKLKRADYWKRICAAVDDKNTEMAVCLRAIINERIREITKKLLIQRKYLNLEIETICNATGFPIEQIEQLRQEIC